MNENYFVSLEAGYIIRNVDTLDDAFNIAIADIGRKLNDKGLNFISIGKRERNEKVEINSDKALIVASTALIGLELTMKVFNASCDEHAIKIAKSQIGKALPHTSLDVLDVYKMDFE